MDRDHRELVSLLPRLRRFAYGLSGTFEAADDLVQEALTRLLHNSKPVDGFLDRWLFRTIRNLHIDQVRSHAVKERHAHLFEHGVALADGDQDMEILLTLDQVREMIEKLPEVQKEVLLLVGIEGFSYRETSDILNIPMGTVTSRLARARDALLRSDTHGFPTPDQAEEATRERESG